MAYIGTRRVPVGVVVSGEKIDLRDPLSQIHTVVLSKPGQSMVRVTLGYLSGSLFEIGWVGNNEHFSADPKV